MRILKKNQSKNYSVIPLHLFTATVWQFCVQFSAEELIQLVLTHSLVALSIHACLVLAVFAFTILGISAAYIDKEAQLSKDKKRHRFMIISPFVTFGSIVFLQMVWE